jgi:hypothetical protein
LLQCRLDQIGVQYRKIGSGIIGKHHSRLKDRVKLAFNDRALIEEKLNGVMVSVGGQFDMSFVPFETLVDPKTLVTKVRFIDGKSDFFRLARLLEQKTNS